MHRLKKCPYCGDIMILMDEPHLELDFNVYESYWECFECGCCITYNPTGYDGDED